MALPGTPGAGSAARTPTRAHTDVTAGDDTEATEAAAPKELSAVAAEMTNQKAALAGRVSELVAALERVGGLVGAESGAKPTAVVERCSEIVEEEERQEERRRVAALAMTDALRAELAAEHETALEAQKAEMEAARQAKEAALQAAQAEAQQARADLAAAEAQHAAELARAKLGAEGDAAVWQAKLIMQRAEQEQAHSEELQRVADAHRRACARMDAMAETIAACMAQMAAQRTALNQQ